MCRYEINYVRCGDVVGSLNMALLMDFVSALMREFVFFSNDVKTTTIAIAITGSVCCSVVWLLLHFLSVVSKHPRIKEDYGTLPGNIPSCPIIRRSSLQIRSPFKQSVLKPSTVWKSTTDMKIPCMRCSSNRSENIWSNVLCYSCCTQSTEQRLIYTGDKAKDTKLHNSCLGKRMEIDLSNQNLSRCPDRVGYLGCHLVLLNLAHNSLLSIPIELGLLLGLKYLDLRSNRLSLLPESIMNLRNLEQFFLGDNKLHTLPVCIGHLKNLQLLSVVNNCITSVPTTIRNLKLLKAFNAGNNYLCEIPEELFQLENLKILKLNNNKLHSLPFNIYQMIRLTELDVSRNILYHLPDSITNCAFLKCLKASQNRLSTLPKNFHQLKDLKELYVSNNKLRYLPSTLHSVSLVIITVHCNPLWNEESQPPFETRDFNDFPLLSEICLRVVHTINIKWWKHSLPNLVKENLQEVESCCDCGRKLVIDRSSAQLKYYTFPNGHKLPLFQVICPSHYSKRCNFMMFN